MLSRGAGTCARSQFGASSASFAVGHSSTMREGAEVVIAEVHGDRDPVEFADPWHTPNLGADPLKPHDLDPFAAFSCGRNRFIP